MHEVLVNRLGGLSLPRKTVVRLTDRPDMTLDVYRGRKTTIQQQYNNDKDVKFQVIHPSVWTDYYICHIMFRHVMICKINSEETMQTLSR